MTASLTEERRRLLRAERELLKLLTFRARYCGGAPTPAEQAGLDRLKEVDKELGIWRVTCLLKR